MVIVFQTNTILKDIEVDYIMMSHMIELDIMVHIGFHIYRSYRSKEKDSKSYKKKINNILAICEKVYKIVQFIVIIIQLLQDMTQILFDQMEK